MLLLTAALVGPYFIDWTSYRAEFEAEASSILGRPVTVQGDAAVRLLPFPSVTFADVRVEGDTPGETVMTAETFSLDAELAPLMSGEFRIFDMRLSRPEVVVTIDREGRADWAVRPNSPFSPQQTSVEALTINDGRIEIRHESSGRTHTLSDIDATLSARSLAGPWRMDGRLEADGLPMAISASTGTYAEDGEGLRVRVTAHPETAPISLDLDGQMRLVDAKPVYEGRLALDLAAAQPAATGNQADQPQAPRSIYRLNGVFRADNQRIALNEYRFETGSPEQPYTADGSASLEFGEEPRFTIEARGAQVQFDETVAGAETTEASALTLDARLDALQNVLANLPKPTIPGRVDVNLPAVVAGDTTIRDVVLSASPETEGWRLERFAATLPGRTTLEGDGLLKVGADFGFTGRMLVAIAQPSGFAAWLSRDVDDAVRDLPGAGFDAQVTLTRDQQRFDNLELVLGDARFQGRVDRRQPPDARASMLVDLGGGALDLDGLNAFASIFVNTSGETRLSDHDLDFQISAGPVSAGGLVADRVDTALRLRDERLEIDRLAVNGMAGASLSATGRIDQLDQAPTGTLDASVVSDDLGPLLAQASQRFADSRLLRELAARAEAYPGLFADTRLDILAESAGAGAERSLSVTANGASGGTALQINGSVADLSQPVGEQALKLTVDARNDNATVLVALGGIPTLPLGLLGPGDAHLTMDGTRVAGFQTSLGLRGEAFDAGFDGSVSLAGDAMVAKGDVRLSSDDLEPWLMTTGMGTPGIGLGLPVGIGGALTLAEGRVTTSLEGSWNGQEISGETAATIVDGRPAIAGSLSVETLDLDPVLPMLFGADALATADDGGWPTRPFPQQGNLPFTLDLTIASGQAAIGSWEATDTQLKLRLDSDGFRVSDLEATYAGGHLTGNSSLQNSGGTGLLSAQFELAGASIAALPGLDALQGQASIGASLSSSGKSAEGLIAALSGSGTARVERLVIDGLNPQAMPALLGAADTVGRTVDDIAVADFAPDILNRGRFPAGNADIPFTLAGGSLRMPLTTFRSDAATLTTEGAMILTSTALAGRATVAYNPGDDALVGSEPVATINLGGDLDEPEIGYDTTALAQYLTQRALEIEQARVEAMQAALLEQQRLRREVRYYQSLDDQRTAAEAARLAEEVRLNAERERAETERIARETEAREAAETTAREAEAARLAAEEAERLAQQPPEEAPIPPEPEAPAPAPAPTIEIPDNPVIEVPETPGGLTPLPPPSDPGAGGTLPGVFENVPPGG